MAYNLTKYEQETIINYNNAETDASIYTCDRKLIRKLDKYCANSPLIYRGKIDEPSRTYIIPKKYIAVRFPRELSEKLRSEMALRAKECFAGNKKDDLEK